MVGIGGVALGSFLAQMFLAAEPTDTAWYMERRFDFGQYGSGAGITREGWRHEESVTWMDAANASLAVPVEKENDRLVMVLKGVLPKGRSATRFEFYANDTLLQTWQSDPSSSAFGRVLKIPHGAVQSQTVLLGLRSDGEAKLGLTSLDVIEFNEIGPYKGTLDHCSRDRVHGWAVADGVASHVAVTVDDKPAKGRLTAMNRADLVREKLPADAGFRFIFAEPLPPGSVVKVVQANGRRVNGSPCTVK